jgi:hypothetical protein
MMVDMLEVTANDSGMDQPLNYFSYNTEIEDAFIRRRGKHLHLCSLDWAMMDVWKERGIPLHVVLRGIECWFDRYESRKPKRPVNTLLYCQEEIEAQYAEWLESRVGGHDEPETEGKQAAEGKSPFPRDAVLAHLGRGLDTLGRLGEERARTHGDEFSEALARAVTLLSEIKDDYASAAQPDTRKLEDSLTGIERLLDEAIRRAAPENELESANAEIDSQMKPYKRHMDKAAFEQTRENLLRKRLRDQFGVPRLSLFFL